VNTKPPATALTPKAKLLRVIAESVIGRISPRRSQLERRQFYRGPNAQVGAAAAQVSRHRLVNLSIGRLGLFGQKGRSLHELAGLAVATLGHFKLDPSLLKRVQPPLAQMLYGGDASADDITHRNAAGSDCGAIKMDGATPAQPGAATETGSGESKFVA